MKRRGDWGKIFMRQHALELMPSPLFCEEEAPSMVNTPEDLLRTFRAARVIPVLTLESVADAISVAKALVDGGLPVLEVTLRTPAALDCVKAIADQVEGAVVGVGTVLSPADIDKSAAVGARFAVSPGLTDALASCQPAVPLLPGVATATEVMRASDAGFRFVKLFPAAAAGGEVFLRAIASPIPHMFFCPTGGVRPSNLQTYVSLPNVACVGGTWLATESAIAARDWSGIQALAVEAKAAAGG